MTFSPVPDDNYTPLPHEVERSFNVYIDESSQSALHYLLIGGLVVPWTHAAQLEADIIAARNDASLREGHEMKWEKARSHDNVTAYKKVIKKVFDFRRINKLPLYKDVAIHCVAVNTSIRPLKQTGMGDSGVGYDVEFYFLCNNIFRKRYAEQTFSLFLDRRHPSKPLREVREILNLGAKKYGDQRDRPFRRLRFADPERCHALQLVDVIIGGIAFKLNGHYDAPDANRFKRQLSDYLFELFKFTDIFYQAQLTRNDFCTVRFRPPFPYRQRPFPPKT
jgi:hypothetical protein